VTDIFHQCYKGARRMEGLAAITTFVVLAILCAYRHNVPLSESLSIEVTLAPAHLDVSEPIIVAGDAGSADFLYLRRIDADRIVLGEDSWGYKGAESAPIAFAPGKPHRLDIISPALAAPYGAAAQFFRKLRVRCDGAPVFEIVSHFYRHNPDQIRFGTNAAGGISTGARLNGTIRDIRGHDLHTAADVTASGPELVASWLTTKVSQVIAVALLSAFVFWATRKLKAIVAADTDYQTHQTSPAPRRSSGFSWWIFTAGFVALSLFLSRQSWPTLPTVMKLGITFPPPEPGKSESILSAGSFGAADFVVITYRDRNTAVLSYDAWGVGGPTSQPFDCVAATSHSLEIQMPALANLASTIKSSHAPLQIAIDAREILRADVSFHSCKPSEFYFGQNPIGGTVGAPFRGKIISAKGDLLVGDLESYFGLVTRLKHWLRTDTLSVAFVVIFSASIGAIFPWFVRRVYAIRPRALVPLFNAVEIAERNRVFVGVTFVSLVAAWLAISYGTGKLIYPEPFAVFFDYQARSLLEGHLDVPLQAIGGEAFIYGGKYYGYFGPTAALLRIPFAVFDLAFGQLSRVLMLCYFMGSVTAAYLILRTAFRLCGCPASAPSRPATAYFLLNAGIGSTLFFLCGRAFMFHETILCGVVFALFSGWCALRYFEAPETRWWIGAVACALASVQARPPIGLFAFTFLGAIYCAVFLRDWFQRRRDKMARPSVRKLVALVTICGLGVFSFNGMSYLKFKTFEGAPLRYSQPYGPERLAHIDGKSFHRANIPWGFYCYVLHPNCRFEPHFPYLFIGSDRPGWDFPNAKIDLPDYMLACPYAMPGLFALATIGCALAFWRAPESRLLIAAAWLAVLPMALALFAAIAIAQRYTGDFCPFLIIAAAFGAVGVERCSPVWRGVGRILLGLITITAVLITFALTFDYQGRWGPNMQREVQQRYEAVAQRIDRTVDAWIAR
jgi:hypothetical protein